MSSFTVDVPAGPIWNQQDAEKKCPMVCAAHLGKWNGQWKTVIEGEMSVCGCTFDLPYTGSDSYTMDVLAGPIWNQDDSKEKCPVVCASYGGEWNGQWTTVIEGKMSVCGCTFKIK
ncbi:Mannan-binding protein [Propionispira arboris]|uniref:Mannan-binding protein n=1 Tax=Propionispira arboris TaxID=84035 RepID=A0A1H7D6Q2_9FIRM|nr:mannan-binding lectin [Propionispira arboris]SEJ97436.1 Mannan-binding protein [Propionispira arboris]